MSAAVTATVKSHKGLIKWNKIVSTGQRFESYERDIRSGDILGGGVILINVELDWKYKGKLSKTIQNEFDELMRDATVGDFVELYGITIHKTKSEVWLSTHDKRYTMMVPDESKFAKTFLFFVLNKVKDPSYLNDLK